MERLRGLLVREPFHRAEEERLTKRLGHRLERLLYLATELAVLSDRVLAPGLRGEDLLERRPEASDRLGKRDLATGRHLL